jgi:hypothetical protein
MAVPMASDSRQADDVLALHDALDQSAVIDRPAGELVKARHFAGLNTEQAAEVLGLPARTAYRTWLFARAKLLFALFVFFS